MDPGHRVHHDRGYLLIIVIWTFTSIAVVMVILRLYTRIKIIRSNDFGDAFIALSMVWHYLQSPWDLEKESP